LLAKAAANAPANKDTQEPRPYAALWIFVSLLAGAFAAGLCSKPSAGRQRDLL